jgi:hypothetical protein
VSSAKDHHQTVRLGFAVSARREKKRVGCFGQAALN